MRTALALALVSLAAGCGGEDDPPAPQCGGSETVLTQQFPTGGLSSIDQNPEQVALNPNPALIDGITEVGAGLDIGFGRISAADNRLREIGAQLADVGAVVNRIDVYVDDALTAQVASAFTWTAYRSDDNQSWTLVSSGDVAFGLFARRFEIPIAATQARYLKVVTRPLLPSVTDDPNFDSVFVTEVMAVTQTTTCVVP
jgi:hypothetical protein